jgi:peptide-methionine (S)-S-oxide reductase
MELEKATLAGGCFWCTEAIFKRVKGVEKVTSGYTGGNKENPSYHEVSEGITGHAEAVQIEFDPNVITYPEILEIFWHTHDPTTKNQQGADVGTQYRSAVFYHNEKQKDESERIKSELEEKKSFPAPIVTEIVQFTHFYPAEDYQ